MFRPWCPDQAAVLPASKRACLGDGRLAFTTALAAGLGYGGSCFPKDVDWLIHTAGRLGHDCRLLRTV